MRGTIVILCLVAFLTERTSGNATQIVQPKIIGGRPIDIRYRPFMLSLHNSREFQCGASILSRTWGITALHCLMQVRRTQYYVRAGSNKRNKGGSLHRITDIHIYDSTYVRSWDYKLLKHDIALFEVRPPFRFSRIVQPIGLPKSTEIKRELIVCGWGYIDPNINYISPILMGVNVQYVPFETCKTFPTYAKFVNKDYHLCYGSLGKDSCYGDSGGPLADRNTIYGIVSFGYRCGIVAGIYVNVSYYRKWIENVTKLNFA